jgi:hypothetical protein
LVPCILLTGLRGLGLGGDVVGTHGVLFEGVGALSKFIVDLSASRVVLSPVTVRV